MLRDLLLSRTDTEFDAAKPAALEDVAQYFPQPAWECRADWDPYTEANYNTLWSHEARAGLRRALEEDHKGLDDYQNWLGETHYNRVVAYSTRLFADGYHDNQGWRALALGIPAAGVVALGLASNYQNAQNHTQLGRASNVFYNHINAVCRRQGVEMPGRPVDPHDWDRRGLMVRPVLEVCDVDVSGLDDEEPGLWLKEVRTTTVKKTVASFMTVAPLDAADEQFDNLYASVLDQLSHVAAVLIEE